MKSYNQFVKESIDAAPIPDLDLYLSRMEKGMESKLFFLNKIDTDCIVDFGCANGAILKKIHQLKPNIKLIGYDLDDRMIEILNKENSDILFTDDWELVKKELEKYKNPTLYLSSVIHEVYSYGSPKNIRDFWKEQVFINSFKYIAVRDMIPSLEHMKFSPIFTKIVREKANPKQLKEFEKYWGPINNYRTLLHWLLKYPYTENWKRELHENYLPITIEELNKKIPSNWSKLYYKHYTFSYMKERIKKDFNIDLDLPTHLKMILENEAR